MTYMTINGNPNPQNEAVVVLHSGGLDSTTCLALACATYRPENVYPVMFDYGQTHIAELDRAERIAVQFRTHYPVRLSVRALATLAGSALTNSAIAIEQQASLSGGNTWAAQRGLPSTFVPGRNLVFLSLAAAYAARIGAHTLMTGVCEADVAGYPDCRGAFLDGALDAIREALGEPDMDIVAPLLHKNKAQTFAMAEALGVLDVAVEDTMTCYRGVRDQRHDWGYGCAECPACIERANGWAAFHAMKQATEEAA